MRKLKKKKRPPLCSPNTDKNTNYTATKSFLMDLQMIARKWCMGSVMKDERKSKHTTQSVEFNGKFNETSSKL